jgi:hypothetical protein
LIEDFVLKYIPEASSLKNSFNNFEDKNIDDKK